MKVTCYSCKNVFDITEEELGNRVKCPKCYYVFRFLAPSTDAEIALHEQEIKKEKEKKKIEESKIGKTSKIEDLKYDGINPNWLKKKIKLLHETKYYEFEAIIDTRFKDCIALPKNVIETLGLIKTEDSEYYSGFVTMELLKKSESKIFKIMEDDITITLPYIVEDIISYIRIGTKTLEEIKDKSEFPLGAFILFICTILLGLGWIWIPVKAIYQGDIGGFSAVTIPGWELGSALTEGFVNLAPLLIGIAGIALFFFGLKNLSSLLFFQIEAVCLKKKWEIFLKELG